MEGLLIGTSWVIVFYNQKIFHITQKLIFMYIQTFFFKKKFLSLEQTITSN